MQIACEEDEMQFECDEIDIKDEPLLPAIEDYEVSEEISLEDESLLSLD